MPGDTTLAQRRAARDDPDAGGARCGSVGAGGGEEKAMGTLVERDKLVEKRKRYLFFGVAGAGLVAGLGVTWILGLPVLGVATYLGFDWFKFRAKRGMRF
jgi:hypothetical protein